jgi:hypothetical protein
MRIFRIQEFTGLNAKDLENLMMILGPFALILIILKSNKS